MIVKVFLVQWTIHIWMERGVDVMWTECALMCVRVRSAWCYLYLCCEMSVYRARQPEVNIRAFHRLWILSELLYFFCLFNWEESICDSKQSVLLAFYWYSAVKWLVKKFRLPFQLFGNSLLFVFFFLSSSLFSWSAGEREQANGQTSYRAIWWVRTSRVMK